MGKSAIIFPGQGSQVVGMGRDVYASSSRAKDVFDEANEVIGFDLAKLCFEGPAEKLEPTDIQQPAILVTSVAILEAYRQAGGDVQQFQCTGGLSLGEYTALYFAGALSFADAVRLVQHRGALMQEAAAATPSGMVSLIGADEEKARQLCDLARGDGVLSPANYNCPGQIVISGDREACARAVDLAGDVGCRAIALAVAGAFHSTLMQSAAHALENMLIATNFQTPRIPVVANVNTKDHTNPDDIRDWLCRQVTQPVLWQKSIERMIAEGVDRFVEVGPGRVLTGMMKKIDRQATALNMSSVEAIEKIIGEPV